MGAEMGTILSLWRDPVHIAPPDDSPSSGAIRNHHRSRS